MDLEKRLDLITGIGEETVTREELRTLLETKKKPVAYDGFEPSGIAHLPVGVYRPILIKDLQKAGIKFKLLVADSFGWINNKLGGDLEKIREVGNYFVEVWKAAGVDMDKVDVIWHKEHFDDPEYWKKVILVAKHHTEARTKRALDIAGRSESDKLDAAQMFYPSMQCADIFQLKADICQLGMDQRKVNMLAREIGPKLGWWKPVVISHHLLLGLQGGSSLKAGETDPTKWKMSKSKQSSAIFVHDTDKEIKKKIQHGFCPAKEVEGNPILDYTKEIVFRAKKEFTIKRPAKFGGDLSYGSYKDVETDFKAGKLHPLDLKNGVADEIIELITPIRNHFEKNKKAKKLYDTVKSYQVTR